MPALHRIKNQIDSSIIATSAIGSSALAPSSVTFSKTALQEFTAVATLPPGGNYVTFATAFGTPPHVDLVEPGSPSLRTKVGTYRADVVRIRPGSFLWAGTPSLKFRWYAYGL